jgi:hypothetical protein
MRKSSIVHVILAHPLMKESSRMTESKTRDLNYVQRGLSMASLAVAPRIKTSMHVDTFT